MTGDEKEIDGNTVRQLADSIFGDCEYDDFFSDAPNTHVYVQRPSVNIIMF